MNIGNIIAAYRQRRPASSSLEQRNLRANGVRLPQDALLLHTLSDTHPPAPQGAGENKHAATDLPREEEIDENTLDIDETTENPSPFPGDYAHRYRTFSALDVSAMRKRLENRVRRTKKERKKCPFCTRSTQCSRPWIRCGERTQYSLRETGTQQRSVHHCTYSPHTSGDHVLIFDPDETMGNFCRASFSLFCSYDPEKITVVSSAREALRRLSESKLSGFRFGLVLCDCSDRESEGAALVDELYDRNFDCDIVAMHKDRSSRPPQRWIDAGKGSSPIPFIAGYLKKPFHSNELIDILRKLDFSRNLHR